MIDIGWNFEANDIQIFAGDLNMIDAVSQQNGAMIFLKSVANISNAEVGVGFEELYPNMPPSEYNNFAATGETQMINDGAQTANVSVYPDFEGNVRYSIEVRYRE